MSLRSKPIYVLKYRTAVDVVVVSVAVFAVAGSEVAFDTVVVALAVFVAISVVLLVVAVGFRIDVGTAVR